jgi:vacuolar-type H+-ATPase subunit H
VIFGLSISPNAELVFEAHDAGGGSQRHEGRCHVTEARARAETVLNDARSKAETLERQSREKAASLERGAARKHTEIIGSLSQEKSVLEKKIGELRAFERGYRTCLKTYLDAQLRELGGNGVGAPADPMRTQQGLVGSGFGAHAEAGSR